MIQFEIADRQRLKPSSHPPTETNKLNLISPRSVELGRGRWRAVGGSRSDQSVRVWSATGLDRYRGYERRSDK